MLTSSRDVEHHLPSGERARAGAGGGAVPARYSWAHLHAQHWLWNQAPGEGLDLGVELRQGCLLSAVQFVTFPDRISVVLLLSVKRRWIAPYRWQSAYPKYCGVLFTSQGKMEMGNNRRIGAAAAVTPVQHSIYRAVYFRPCPMVTNSGSWPK